MDRRKFLQAGMCTAPAKLLGASERIPATRHAKAIYEEMTNADYDIERRRVHMGYGQIAYVERGKGEAALFLHGFPLNSFQWRAVIPRLSHYRRCVAPDLLGLGFTEVREGKSVT